MFCGAALFNWLSLIIGLFCYWLVVFGFVLLDCLFYYIGSNSILLSLYEFEPDIISDLVCDWMV